MQGKKIIIVIAAIIVVCAGGAAGVMAAMGVFRSDKADAMKLLAQAPERLSWTSTGEYVGDTELLKAMYEKGSKVDISLENLKIAEVENAKGSDAKQMSEFFDGFKMGLSGNTDAAGRFLMNIHAEKNSIPVNINYFSDASNLGTFYLSAPEIIADKVFKVESGVSPAMSNLDMTMFQKFYIDATEFVQEEAVKVAEDISCDKMADGGYEVTIPKDAVVKALEDTMPFMEGQAGIVNYINTLANNVEDNYDFLAKMRGEIEEMKAQAKDISLLVYGNGKDLASIKLADANDKDEVISLEFGGQKGDSTATLKFGSAEQTVSLTIKDEKKEKYATSFVLEMSGDARGKISCTETINPSDNSCEIEMAIDDSSETEDLYPITFTARGSVKDIKKGSYADYVLDDVVVSQKGEEVCTMSMDIKVGVQDGEVKALEGKEVEIKDSDSDVFSSYENEAYMALANIAIKWGLISESDMSDMMEVAA